MKGLRALSDRDFTLFQALIHDAAGIYLSPAKKALLVARLSRRLRELDLDSFSAYYRRVVDGDQDERVRMLDAICTNETRFFREPRQFEFLEQRVYPEWAAEAAAGSRPRRIRAWSTACSTGEEPYSLAMSLLSRFPADGGWQVEVVATDLSTRALERAVRGVYSLEKAIQISEPHRKRFMLKGVRGQDGSMKVGANLRSVVQFARVNLNESRCPVAGPFDLILCRNVLIYFSAESRAGVIGRLLDRLAPRGYFLLGHAETLNFTDRVRSVGPTVYAPRDAARRGAGAKERVS